MTRFAFPRYLSSYEVCVLYRRGNRYLIQLSIEKLQRFAQLIREKDGVGEKDLADYLKW
jgi:hypothetical protein